MRSNEQMSEQIVGLKTNGWALTDESREEFFRTNNDDNMSAQERAELYIVPRATGRQGYPRYSTRLFLSRTATDEPGSARQSVALEPSSKSILNSALVS
jgi:hypothetical protein